MAARDCDKKLEQNRGFCFFVSVTHHSGYIPKEWEEMGKDLCPCVTRYRRGARRSVVMTRVGPPHVHS